MNWFYNFASEASYVYLLNLSEPLEPYELLSKLNENYILKASFFNIVSEA